MKNIYIDAIMALNSLSDTGTTDLGKLFQVPMEPR